MAHRSITASRIGNELQFTTSRSSGPGGQNVNKVNTKVTIKWDIPNSFLLTPEEKEIILRKIGPRLTTAGVLIIVSQDKRSQLQNKEAAIEKLERVIAKAFEKKKVRKATKPTKSSIKNKQQTKQKLSEKKKWRQKPI